MKSKILLFSALVLLLGTAFISCKKDPTDIKLNKSTLVLTKGKTVTLTATIYPKNADKSVTWTTSDSKVVTVEEGVVTAIALGKATISVTTKVGNFKAECLIIVIEPIEPEMVVVEGGPFTMGCTDGDCFDNNELPAHQVTLNSFKIGKYEIRQEEWLSVMDYIPVQWYNGVDYPVEYISRDEVQKFIQTLNEATGKNYRLPTEAEWEFAARGGNKSKRYKYSGSNNVDEVAWYSNPDLGPKKVGGKSPNELGIYDMSGNVYEFCSDWFGDYTGIPQINPSGPSTGTYLVLRGGAYSSEEQFCRIAARRFLLPNEKGSNIGFRLVLP